MNIKLLVGKTIADVVDWLIKINYKLVPFIPNGRLLPLDLKRANIYPENIFDVGANIGQTANYFLKNFPDAEIYSFEPVLSVYKELVANTANTKIKCFNQALGDEKTNSKIYKSETYNGVASINGIGNKDLTTEEIIEITTGEDICAEYQLQSIDLLKIDTEGYELNVLKGFESMLKNKVKLIYAEVCFDSTNPCQTYIITLLEYLSPYGFILSGFYNPYRVGHNKLKLNHCDILFINTLLIDI
jgi:FkbM family methyltransferase